MGTGFGCQSVAHSRFENLFAIKIILMHLLFAKQFFPDEIIKAFCWTLVHSLWQGLVLAIIAGMVIMLTKKSSPVLRYNALSCLFVFFIAVACFTFAWQLNHSG